MTHIGDTINHNGTEYVVTGSTHDGKAIGVPVEFGQTVELPVTVETVPSETAILIERDRKATAEAITAYARATADRRVKAMREGAFVPDPASPEGQFRALERPDEVASVVFNDSASLARYVADPDASDYPSVVRQHLDELIAKAPRGRIKRKTGAQA